MLNKNKIKAYLTNNNYHNINYNTINNTLPNMSFIEVSVVY